MLVEAANERHLQITYDQGRIEIMSPLPRHERVKTLLGTMVGIIALERGIEVCSLGSTTFRRKLLSKGLEPDECFYIQNEPRVRFKDDLDLEVDPPPDLAIEVEVTNRSIKRMPIYSSLGVPEIWRHDGLRLQFLLRDDGGYQPSDKSSCFPFLSAVDINHFLERRENLSETSLMREFRDWVREGI
jgi:Uma2 family endonuclease